MRTFKSVGSVVHRLKPNNPLYIFRPRAVEKAVSCFLNGFKGDMMYAVKTNPDAYLLTQIYNLGVRSFDVASLEEIRHVTSLLPNANCYFMHTVKSRFAIREAYQNYGIRHFALDSSYELQKIMEETDHAKDLCLMVRLSIPNTYAELNLAEKFGANSREAVNLLKMCRTYAKTLGITFHVGSQCMHPDAYRIAMKMASQVLAKAKVNIEILDIGGGFPSIYPGMNPPPLETYFEVIQKEFSEMFKTNPQLICEPGRALAAESGAVIVKVELRKGDHLYINDGTYGNLFDAGIPHFIFPVKLWRIDGEHSDNILPFSFYGPTCDTLDYMKGPFYLPEDVKEGDYIEIGQLGSYGRTLATKFNGFGSEEEIVSVRDNPLMTMYGVDGGTEESMPEPAAKPEPARIEQTAKIISINQG